MFTIVYREDSGEIVETAEGEIHFPKGLSAGLDYRYDDSEAMSKEQKKRLLDSDFTQLSDSPYTEEEKAEWVIYRKALRDMNGQPDWPNIPWPLKPEPLGISIS
jgi:hypothetical protein